MNLPGGRSRFTQGGPVPTPPACGRLLRRHVPGDEIRDRTVTEGWPRSVLGDFSPRAAVSSCANSER